MTFSIQPAGYKCVYIEIDGLSVEVNGSNGILRVTPVNNEGEKIALKKTRIYQGGVWTDENSRSQEIRTEMQKISEVIFYSEDRK
ncbi:MAG: hypothetical protein CML44_05845 [Rhodobacteraceae bacterium]|nr:hypothetical protein [Paracoccaceae bacterium]|tara:strand:- start:1766 stop:2020 length:255 start_codon:yes stop_codon:yes gene_type:complete